MKEKDLEPLSKPRIEAIDSAGAARPAGVAEAADAAEVSAEVSAGSTTVCCPCPSNCLAINPV